jgi:hypothetical protein
LERRILLVNMPRLLRDLIKELLTDDPSAVVVAEAMGIDQGLAAAPPSADFVIVGANDDELPAPVSRLLADQSYRMAVLSVVNDGERGFLHVLKPHRVSLGPLTGERLLSSIGPRTGSLT